VRLVLIGPVLITAPLVHVAYPGGADMLGSLDTMANPLSSHGLHLRIGWTDPSGAAAAAETFCTVFSLLDIILEHR
jgi:hypothetical protein